MWTTESISLLLKQYYQRKVKSKPGSSSAKCRPLDVSIYSGEQVKAIPNIHVVDEVVAFISSADDYEEKYLGILCLLVTGEYHRAYYHLRNKDFETIEEQSITEDPSWLLPKPNSKPLVPDDWLYKVIPVLLIKIHEHQRYESFNAGFHAFLLGTHPRLGEQSCVRLLTGLYPVLKIIHNYTQINLKTCQEADILNDQIHDLW